MDRRDGEVVRVEDSHFVFLRDADECTVMLRNEDDVRRLVSDEERSNHGAQGQVDDRNRIRQMIDDPDFGSSACPHGHRLDSDLDLGDAGRLRSGQIEHDEPMIRRVCDEETASVRRELDGVDGRTLEMIGNEGADGRDQHQCEPEQAGGQGAPQGGGIRHEVSGPDARGKPVRFGS